ncbi:ecto-NOX disulfide-thiol exchanger 2 isoform X1 [Electrophorus electricus]|uniref:ecto-NOX disulfide-thiol exchanger 2 isoform X1 n=2 Tax=Electrophorus electricus TaxID=8005 RepID=UPI0015D0BCB7|nr:ecto-NOX disulfide-thiol exchanger 2 isoform X1 [Electrophorus electricus]XP_035391924.1 ecto-NOX disulfide-thiol exchanger 2 isoform X1 [Electrophorus electricus]
MMYKDYRSVRAAGLNPLPFDPATNNEPLQFNSSNGPLVSECPLENGTESSGKKRKRTNLPPEGLRNIAMDSSSMGMPMSDPNAWATAMTNLGMAPVGMAGQPLLSDFDPSLGMMTGIAPMNPMLPGLGVGPPPISQDLPVVKEIIHCKSCTLFPPNPNLPPPATRERPPGCKTVFVGGLPENATEQIIVEVFEQCGTISAIRKSKKNFCHIRFNEEHTVDKALFLSGYRIRLGSSTDKKDTGRLHVDYAQARDDLYEWECRQRMLAREERHRRRIEEDRLRPPSPPPIVHYSEHECSQLGEKIKDDSKFPEAVRVLLTWVERGEVNRRNANNFYSMIQSSNSHIRRLMNEKAAHEKEMEEAKEKLKNALAGILVQFEQIVSVFHAASKQKAWDHFSKAQRKNLDMWRKQAEEIRNIHNEELMGIRREEEMEMSDDDMEDEPESKDSDDSGALAQVEALREENDSLRCQLDAYRNEVELLKQEQSKAQPPRSEEDTTRQQQLSFLQQALQGMQKQLLTLREDLKQREVELEKNTEEKQQLESQIQNLKERVQALPTTHTLPLERQDDRGGDESSNLASEAPASAVVSCSQEKESLPEKGPPSPVKSEREALLVGIISTFLHVHPFGASIEYICSYLQRLDTKISTTEVETLLARLPCTFRQELTGVGASLEKRWKFCGFEGIKTA